jgi:hypothetical protein
LTLDRSDGCYGADQASFVHLVENLDDLPDSECFSSPSGSLKEDELSMMGMDRIDQ